MARSADQRFEGDGVEVVMSVCVQSRNFARKIDRAANCAQLQRDRENRIDTAHSHGNQDKTSGWASNRHTQRAIGDVPERILLLTSRPSPAGMSFSGLALPSSVLALATTVHLALAALRHQRPPARRFGRALALPSLLLALGPWAVPTAAGLAMGLVIHLAWFAVCEWIGPSHPPPVEPPVADAFSHLDVIGTSATTADVQTFRFRRPPAFDFIAGQFLPIRIRIGGVDHVRCYSISSGPDSADHIDISVKRQGLVSNALHTQMRPGVRLAARRPAGSFIYPPGREPLILLAGGIGITPLMSMLRHAVVSEPWRPVTLLYSAATEDAFAFRAEIRAIAQAHPQVRAVLAVTRGGGGPDLYAGRIDEALVRTVVPDASEAIALICGPQRMIDGMRTLMSSLGLPAERIRAEVFESVVAATSGRRRRGASAPAGGTAHSVRCARTNASAAAAAGQSLLEAIEAAGIPIDSLCRSGICGTCRTRVLDGTVVCESTLLDGADRQHGYVLACVSRVESDCVVEL
jgi:NADH oxidoreductase Hcr